MIKDKSCYRMVKLLLKSVFLLSFCSIPFSNAANMKNECVILLHGLARTSSSMDKMAESLEAKGYKTVNYDYPSREKSIKSLSETVIPQALNKCSAYNPWKIHFVTHSLGGILVRYYLSNKKISNLGKVVMLSPPNQGSEVVDKLSSFPGFTLINGPAGHELGTDSESVPLNLGPADFELGIITGNKSLNLILSLLIPGKDDGKVSVERAKLQGMSDFLVVPHSHTFIMESDDVIKQTIHFLYHGYFKKIKN